MKTYLVIDPGHSSGYCVFDHVGVFDHPHSEKATATIREFGHFQVDRTSSYQGDWLIDLEKQVQSLIEKYRPVRVIREQYFFSPRTRTGSEVNVIYRGMIDLVARKNDLPYSTVSPSDWKKFICSRTTPTRSQVQHWGKGFAKKFMVQQSLWERYQIRFPNHSYSPKGTRVKFKHDIIDAVAMGVYYASKELEVTQIKSEVPIPPDVTWKRKMISFDYQSLPSTPVPPPKKERRVPKNTNKKPCQYQFKDGRKCTVVPRIQSGAKTEGVWCSKHRPKSE